ncbi:MAG: hypothetical protein QXG17_01360 [Sulfolobales archaeon]
MNTVATYLLAFLSALVAVYGYSARRVVSAISLTVTALLIAGSTLCTQLGIGYIIVAIPISAVSFVIGLFLHRVAISVSASVALSHAFFQLTELRLDYGHAVAVSLVLVFALYVLSWKRGYLPYAVLGSSSFALFMSYSTHAVIAVSLAIALGTASYAIQERSWRAKTKYNKMRYSLKRHRSCISTGGSRLSRKSDGDSKVESF